MGIFQRANKKHLPAQTFPLVPIITPGMVGLHELTSYKLDTVGLCGSMKYEFNHEKPPRSQTTLRYIMKC